MSLKAKEFQSGRGRFVLPLIAFVFVVLVVSYALATDLGGAPDETSHLIYIRTLALEHRLPEISTTPVNSLESSATHEGHQPPLYYAMMAVPYAIMDSLGLSVEIIWRVLRILGAIFGVCWIYSVRRLGAVVFSSESAGLAVAAFVALIPTASFMSGMVNNDVLICLCFGWALALIAQYVKERTLSRRAAIGLGLVMGAAILTKAQGLILLPVFLAAVLWVWLSGKHRMIQPALRVAGAVYVTAFVVGAWWLVRSILIYGHIQPESLSNPLLPNGFADILAGRVGLFEIVKMVFYGTWAYFWAPFWILRHFVDGSIYFAATVTLTTLPVLMLCRRAIACRDMDAGQYGVLLFAAGLLVASWLRHTLVIDFGANLQGRLFLPIAPVVAVVGVAGLEPVLRARWVRLIAAGLVYGGMAVANVLILRCVLAYYAHGYG